MRCEVQGDAVVFRIADNGSGIPDDQKESLFGKREKGLDSTGTGIGLDLVHTPAEQFDVSVWVEDNEPRGAGRLCQTAQSHCRRVRC